METKENNKEEAPLEKKELLSDEQLQEVAGGRIVSSSGFNKCVNDCLSTGMRLEECKKACDRRGQRRKNSL